MKPKDARDKEQSRPSWIAALCGEERCCQSLPGVFSVLSAAQGGATLSSSCCDSCSVLQHATSSTLGIRQPGANAERASLLPTQAPVLGQPIHQGTRSREGQ